MNARGVGDRWMAGEAVPGVAFGIQDAVQVTDGPRTGAVGTIALLIGMTPEPTYLVALRSGGDLRMRQSALRAVD